MTWLTNILAIALSYALGSIPTGLWLGLALRGVDIREHGSKNIGATNTLRVLGKPLGIAALTGDIGKGLAAVLLISRLGEGHYLPLACGLAAICGHMASVFLKFRGGKGVATGCGVFLGLCPIPTGVALGVFAVVVGTTRMVSAGSITGAATLCAMLYFLPNDWPVRAIATVVAAVVVWRHRANIRRILRGEESKVF